MRLRGPSNLQLNGYRFLLGVKRPGREASRSPVSADEIQEGWNYTSAPSICRHGECKVIFNPVFVSFPASSCFFIFVSSSHSAVELFLLQLLLPCGVTPTGDLPNLIYANYVLFLPLSPSHVSLTERKPNLQPSLSNVQSQEDVYVYCILKHYSILSITNS